MLHVQHLKAWLESFLKRHWYFCNTDNIRHCIWLLILILVYFFFPLCHYELASWQAKQIHRPESQSLGGQNSRKTGFQFSLKLGEHGTSSPPTSDCNFLHTLSFKRRDNSFGSLCFYRGSSRSHPSFKWANSTRLLGALCYRSEEIILARSSFSFLGADILGKFSYCVNSAPERQKLLACIRIKF